MAKTVKPIAKAKKAPKVAEKKTPKKALVKKLVVEKLPDPIIEEVPVVIPEAPEPDHVEHIEFKEEKAPEKEPVSDFEKKREAHYAALGTIDYYVKHVKGK